MRILIIVVCVMLAGCNKMGLSQHIDRFIGNWVPMNLPAGCVAKQIAAEEHGGVVVLCEDGRVFH